MKALKFTLIATCTILLLTRCSKDVNKSSRISTPELILGKWNLVGEEDTTFYLQHLDASSWNFRNWFYNFREGGILEISNNNTVDSFTYYFSDESCVNIGWVGWPNDTYTDTILQLTEANYVFKHWETNPDDSKTKKVYFLSK